MAIRVAQGWSARPSRRLPRIDVGKALEYAPMASSTIQSHGTDTAQLYPVLQPVRQTDLRSACVPG